MSRQSRRSLLYDTAYVRLVRCLFVPCVVAALAACSADNTTATPSGPVVLTLNEGDTQGAVVGQPLSIAPSVRATRSGVGAAGVTVTYVVVSGGGSVSGASPVTDANGIARLGGWTLGTVAGVNALSATATGGASVVFTATGRAGNASAIVKLSGDAQTATVGEVLVTRPSVRVTDSFGNPVANIPVAFAVTQGGGTIGGASTGSVTTGADGTATLLGYALGTTPGTNTLTATVTGVPVSTFTSTARVGTASAATKVSGDAQIVTVGQSLATRPTLRVTDQFGNGVSGASVTFTAAANSGSITGATQIAGADGSVTLGGWTVGTVPGTQSVTASVTGTNVVATFTATVRAGAATTVTKVSGDQQTIASGSTVLSPPTIKVSDQFGNGVSGVSVNFAVTQGGGSVSGASQLTGDDGTARVSSWILGTATGSNALTATATGAGLTGNPALFSAVGITGPAASLVKVTGDNQSTIAGGDLATLLSVRLADRFGNPVADRTVLFNVTSGGGFVFGATPFTSSTGIATLAGWTLGPAVGTQTVVASVGTLNVVFSASAFAALNPALYAGTYTGTWINTTFGSTDVASATIVINSAASSATVTASAGGSVLGGGPVDPTARTATYNSVRATFTGNVPEMGNITGSITNTATAGVASIDATGTNVPNSAIQRWTATGTLSATVLQLNFTVFFTSGSTAVGTVTLNKQ